MRFLRVFFVRYSHWQPPTMRDPNQESFERKATWLELFFDISFVAAIAELSSLLSHGVTGALLLRYIALYIPIWWLWIGMTFYNDRFDRETKADRFYVFAMMIPIAGLAMTIGQDAILYSTGFITWYVIGRLLLTFLWIRAGYFNPRARRLAVYYSIGFLLAIALWITSIWLPLQWQLIVWAAALLIELLTPMFTVWFQQERMPDLNHSHLTERFGLFTIIVLAEIFLGVVHGVHAVETPSFTVLLLAGLGLLLAFSFWSIYFDDVISHPRMPKAPWNAVWVYTHLPLTMAITMIGSGLVYVISHPYAHLPLLVRFMLCGAIMVALLAIALIEYAHTKGVTHSEEDEHTESLCTQVRIIGVALTALIAVSTLHSSAVVTLSLLALVVVQQVWISVYVRK
jgi:low temperature requirement protein LtrA